MFSSVDEAIVFMTNQGVEFIDVRFCDLPGVMQHFSIPIKAFTREELEEGLMFDGSSIRGFTEIHESDMKLMPDVTTAYVDPFRDRKTLVMNFFVVDPLTGEPYSRDPRTVASKAEEYLKTTGIADTALFAAEAEFYIFDSVTFAPQMGNEYQSSFGDIVITAEAIQCKNNDIPAVGTITDVWPK